jgi:hypothetical protein
MARRRTKKRTTRRFTGVNLLNLAESVVYANIASETMFNLSIREFLDPKHPGYVVGETGSLNVTLKELTNSLMGGTGGVDPATASAVGFQQNAFGAVGQNLRVNAVRGVLQMAGAGIGFKFAKKLTSKPRAQVNRLLKMGGLGSTVRV